MIIEFWNVYMGMALRFIALVFIVTGLIWVVRYVWRCLVELRYPRWMRNWMMAIYCVGVLVTATGVLSLLAVGSW